MLLMVVFQINICFYKTISSFIHPCIIHYLFTKVGHVRFAQYAKKNVIIIPKNVLKIW